MAQHDQRQSGSLESKLSTLAEQVAASMGFDVVLVQLKGGNRSALRVFIDHPNGVTLDDCAQFSKRFSVLLDVEDWIPFSYILEVSSPGLDRPLVKEEDFRRFFGKDAKVRTRTAVEGQKNFAGKILRISQGRLGLEVAPGKQVEIAISEIEKANLVAEI